MAIIDNFAINAQTVRAARVVRSDRNVSQWNLIVTFDRGGELVFSFDTREAALHHQQQLDQEMHS